MNNELTSNKMIEKNNGINFAPKRKVETIDQNANKKRKLNSELITEIEVQKSERAKNEIKTIDITATTIECTLGNLAESAYGDVIALTTESAVKSNTTKTVKASVCDEISPPTVEATNHDEIPPKPPATNDHDEIQPSTSKAARWQSPKKRLNVPKTTNNIQQTTQEQNLSEQKCEEQQQKKAGNEQQQQKKNKFIYGNYSQYYGYRNQTKAKDFHDIRLDIFETHKDLFKAKELLDIGCNMGLITMAFAKNFPIKNIVGLDIDLSLIKQAHKNLTKEKKLLPKDNEKKENGEFPYNISFISGNYVLKDDVLLEIERARFDVILCLSITKWIHLNFGDAGLKQAFKRMYLQLRSGGILILEAQPFDNYKRRKNLTDTIKANYKAIKLYPQDFTSYLLSEEVGFLKMELLAVPEHFVMGFKRPIQIFYKK